MQSGPHIKPISLSMFGEKPKASDGSTSTSPGIKFNPSYGLSSTGCLAFDSSSKGRSSKHLKHLLYTCLP